MSKITVLRAKDTGNTTNTYALQVSDGSRVEFWYDPLSRNWIVHRKDTNDYQVGASDIVGTKGDALYAAQCMLESIERELVPA